MKKNYFSWIVFAIIFSLVFSACDKDIKEATIKPKSGPDRILVFNDANELALTIDSVNSLNYAELELFELARGFISWGRLCEYYYFGIDTVDICDSATIFNYVNQNSEYLVLAPDFRNGYIYEMKYRQIPQFCIMNENRMYIVNDTIYKVFESGILLTGINNYNEILGIADNDLIDYISDDSYIFVERDMRYVDIDENKDASYDLGKEKTFKSTSGNERTRLDFGCFFLSGNFTTSFYEANFIVRPYKKVCFIWWVVSRSISTQNCKIAHDYKNSNLNWDRFTNVIPNYSNVNKSKLVLSYPYMTWGGNSNTHIAGYDVWVDTPSTSPIDVETNANVL
jgi:hypothetical protein